MGTLRTIGTKTKENLGSLLLVALSAVPLLLIEQASHFLASQIPPQELSKAVLSLVAALFLALALCAYLKVQMVGRVDPKDYKRYQPYPGVTVFMEKHEDPSIQFQLRYCPRCLTVDHKLGILQLIPGSGIQKCDRCTQEIRFSLPPDHRL